MFKEFKEFAMRGNVMDLAVGVIIGGTFGKIVSSLVNDIVMPPLGLLLGNINLSQLKITLKSGDGTSGPVTINYGQFITQVLDFVIVAFAVFLMVKAINRLKRQPPPPSPSEKMCPSCCLMIPIAAKKCAHCTSTV